MLTLRLAAPLLSAALVLATATPALADDASTFTRDGQTYTYTQTVLADRTEIVGRVVETRAPFRLTVRGSRVAGTVDGAPVSFVMPRRRTTDATIIAAR